MSRTAQLRTGLSRLWDSQAGFTLAETLVALAVMLLVSLCMCVGVNFAAKSYASSVATSEAKTLCSTLTAEVTSELAYTTAIDVSADGTLVGYFSPTWGNGEGASAGSGTTSLTTAKSQFTLMTTDASGAATYVPAASAPATTTGQLAVNSNKLVSSALYTHGLTASISVAYVGAQGADTQVACPQAQATGQHLAPAVPRFAQGQPDQAAVPAGTCAQPGRPVAQRTGQHLAPTVPRFAQGQPDQAAVPAGTCAQPGRPEAQRTGQHLAPAVPRFAQGQPDQAAIPAGTCAQPGRPEAQLRDTRCEDMSREVEMQLGVSHEWDSQLQRTAELQSVSATDVQAGSSVGHFAITICIYDSSGVEVTRSCFDVTALNLAQVSVIG